MNFLFPQNNWLAWLLLIAVTLIVFVIVGITGWMSLWNVLPYALGVYIFARGFYVYWPRKGASGPHNRALGLVFLGFGLFGLLSTLAIVIFHIGSNDRDTLIADVLGSLICLSFGAMNVLGAAYAANASEEKSFPPP
ncbi:MAG TPA: hypothetical protein VMF67_16185 [Rhizomicrobium sp.]|nr:hypothetical protein [Rhizomicrobium sp.]